MDARKLCTIRTVCNGTGNIDCDCCNPTIGRSVWRRNLRTQLRGVARTRFKRSTAEDIRDSLDN